MGGSGPIVVRGVELDQPRLSLIALEDGTANWNITSRVASPALGDSKAMDLSLRRFEIKDGDIAFDNRRARLKATLKGYNQSLSGDFSQKQVDVQTRLNADTASVTFAGIPYLNRVKLGLTADARADLAQKSYVLKDTELSLNDLKLGVSGSARSVGKLLGLDLDLPGAEHQLPQHPVAGAGGVRPRLRQGEDLGQLHHGRPSQGRVRRQRLPGVRAQRQGERRRLPVSRSPAPGPFASSWIWRSPIPAAAPTAPW